jgi:flavin prenyltransferase
MHIVTAITGASGAVYGIRLCEALLSAGHSLNLLITRAGFAVLKSEAGLDWEGTEVQVSQKLQDHFRASARQLRHYSQDNLLAPIASGSAAPDVMIVCPCSMGTLARIAAGNSGNLLERCADVMLKEHRTLVVVPRETPLSEIHLENMHKLARIGVRVVPAMPAFYHEPQSVGEMVDFIAGKVLDAIGVEHRLYRPWKEPVAE